MTMGLDSLFWDGDADVARFDAFFSFLLLPLSR
jgi:hypothetical protein